jgi:hypothetical protein
MNEFLSRIEPVAATERVSPSIRAVLPVAPATAGTDEGPLDRNSAPVREGVSHVGDKGARAAAAYAQVHARIVSVLAELKAQSTPVHPALLDAAEHSLLSLMPQPGVVLPLLPANQDTVEFVVQVTQSIARQAAQARAAQSHISAAAVDAAVA